jgi:deazaflavin-dependent oxidoreductase (nitroreductase family)
MPAARNNAVMRFIFRIHPWLYRVSGGRIFGSLGGTPILLLNTVGRKSGAPRTNAVMYFAQGDGYAIAASFAGEPKHPAWYLNLKDRQTTSIQVGARTLDVSVRETEGEERRRLWEGIVAQDPSFAVYEGRVAGQREIPVLFLEPERP